MKVGTRCDCAPNAPYTAGVSPLDDPRAVDELIKAVECLQDDFDELMGRCPLCGALGPFSPQRKHKPFCSVERLNKAHEALTLRDSGGGQG